MSKSNCSPAEFLRVTEGAHPDRTLPAEDLHAFGVDLLVAVGVQEDEARTVLRRKRHLTLLRNEAEEEQTGQRPDERMLAEEEWGQVRAALDSLSDRDREVLLLWDAGLSYREIADVTDLSPGAIGTTLARARRRLVEAHGKMEKENAARI